MIGEFLDVKTFVAVLILYLSRLRAEHVSIDGSGAVATGTQVSVPALRGRAEAETVVRNGCL